MVFAGSFLLDIGGITTVPLAFSQNQDQVPSVSNAQQAKEVTAPSTQQKDGDTMSTSTVPPSPPGLPVAEGAVNMAEGPQDLQPLSYDPTTRRDPFAALININKGRGVRRASLPPLQQVGLTELNVIGVLWGGFGFTAMVQTPDGKGYSVRRGTLVGPNNGVVTSITKNGLVVTERFTDIYGRQKEREHIKLLHAEEEFE